MLSLLTDISDFISDFKSRPMIFRPMVNDALLELLAKLISTYAYKNTRTKAKKITC